MSPKGEYYLIFQTAVDENFDFSRFSPDTEYG